MVEVEHKLLLDLDRTSGVDVAERFLQPFACLAMFAREVGFRMGGSRARRRFSAWTDKYTNVPLSDVLRGGDSGIQPHTLILMNDAE